MQNVSGSYRTIKALVFDFVRRSQGKVRYDALTAAVLKEFPQSLWKRSHWAWYRHQILRGRFREQFSEEERHNLEGPGRKGDSDAAPEHPARRGPSPSDPEVKRLGDAILDVVRSIISQKAGDDPDLAFKLNRWVFSRLLLDERRLKGPIKKKLWESGMRVCGDCGHRFSCSKGVEVHRKDPSRGYSVENCEFLCRECHQELESRPTTRPMG